MTEMCDPTDNDYSGCHTTAIPLPKIDNPVTTEQPVVTSPSDQTAYDLDTMSEGFDRIEQTGGFA